MKGEIAIVTDKCTGCGGAPVCRVFCGYGALELRDDPETFPFRRMHVVAERCTGCGGCVARGPKGSRILGCPWDAIRLVPASRPASPS